VAALLCVQLLTVEFLDQVSGVHDADAVGEVGDFGKDVTGHEDGGAVLGRQRLGAGSSRLSARHREYP
jgi:hypothetical protein